MTEILFNSPMKTSKKKICYLEMYWKEVEHQYLRSKLTDLWKLQESVIFIDLGEDYYTVKLALEES